MTMDRDSRRPPRERWRPFSRAREVLEQLIETPCGQRLREMQLTVKQVQKNNMDRAGIEPAASSMPRRSPPLYSLGWNKSAESIV